ncbi:type III pantothenate kinase [Novimethylophilus kurashikiensis]|uniref:Type III pantothenate kinase n=1 Tax=Novimethylophilus kurashikiensis TaxID=1825523 RepID=A0A2R5F324_9PROT|nr:type III pantothenate kinase [Novimethylophilus kurashikiensis]GBG12775.1 type III pantothenate kinase [Novimethylophilus kurashikiensis]
MLLAVDAGNTRVKWGVHDGTQWLAQGAIVHREIPALAALWQAYSISQTILSNVAGVEVQAALEALLAPLNVVQNWVQSSAQCCGVRNGYSVPEQLGTDRWAALIAAWQQEHSACVVASVGTALTVDALSSQGEFLGGYIVPGLTLMKRALLANTAGVAETEGNMNVFPNSTGEAVESGAIAALAGSIESMCRNLAEREGVTPALLLTGGDALSLQPALSSHAVIVDNLVLDGLVRMAKEIAR